MRVHFHMMLDQPSGAFGDKPRERFQARGDMVAWINRFSHVVQECGE